MLGNRDEEVYLIHSCQDEEQFAGIWQHLSTPVAVSHS